MKKFTPCQDKCTYEGSHCEGCGRSHSEISETKKLTQSIIHFLKSENYDNPELFLISLNQKILKKIQRSK